jgi:hypothetical protein
MKGSESYKKSMALYKSARTAVRVGCPGWEVFCFLKSTLKEWGVDIRYCEFDDLSRSIIHGVENAAQVLWDTFPEDPDKEGASTESMSYYQQLRMHDRVLCQKALQIGRAE